MKILLIHPCEPSVGSWVRGEFIDQRTVITWAKEDGRGFIYTLSPRYMYYATYYGISCAFLFRGIFV
jgi:hypothetical protein